MDHAKTTKRATSSRRLVATTSQREIANIHHLPERWKMDNSTLPMNLSWQETVQLLFMQRIVITEAVAKFEIAKQLLAIRSI